MMKSHDMKGKTEQYMAFQLNALTNGHNKSISEALEVQLLV